MSLAMAPVLRASRGRTTIAAALVAGSLCGFASPSLAAPAWLRNAWGAARRADGGESQAPRLARFSIDEGGVFVLDRSAPRPLLKFDDSPEVWVLWPVRGPRGDVIYKNDLGEPMLRATKLGGMTVFTPRRPTGAAAALAGASSPLRLSPIGPVALLQRVLQASVRASRAAQHLIGFDAPDADAASDGVIADAAGVAAEAIVTLSARPGGKTVLARIDKVAFVEGARADVIARRTVITITIVPAQGFAGRPSSLRILSAVGVR
jgi:hypothetical protein